MGRKFVKQIARGLRISKAHGLGLFTHKVSEAMRISGNHPMEGDVHEFVVGGKENGTVKRFYSLVIRDLSAQLLRGIFDNYIGGDAQVTTDEWRGYRPISGDFRFK